MIIFYSTWPLKSVKGFFRVKKTRSLPELPHERPGFVHSPIRSRTTRRETDPEEMKKNFS